MTARPSSGPAPARREQELRIKVEEALRAQLPLANYRRATPGVLKYWAARDAFREYVAAAASRETAAREALIELIEECVRSDLNPAVDGDVRAARVKEKEIVFRARVKAQVALDALRPSGEDSPR